MYKSIAILMKIEEKLPKRISLKATSHFPQEPTLNPPEGDNKYPTTKEYIRAMMKDSDKFYLTMRPIFVILEAFSWVVVGFTVGIALVVFIPQFVNFLKNLPFSLLV